VVFGISKVSVSHVPAVHGTPPVFGISESIL